MKKNILLVSLITLTLAFTACSNKDKEGSVTEGGMKCGPGKCGASMVDGSAVLVKKKMNILEQLKADDSRRDCVLKANTTKALYACVRVEKTGRLSTKCASDNIKEVEVMKCEAGKCSTGKDVPKKDVPKKESAAMKCEAGKCGSSM